MSAVWIRNGNTWKQSSIYVRVGGVWKLCTIPILYTAELVIHILAANNNTTANQNVDVKNLFEATYPGSWSAGVSKRVIVDPGAIVGATNTSNYALNIPSGFGGTVKIDNNGSIQGAGGVGSSVQGGNAIFAGAAGISINNQGTIYAGGGSGGSGGTGGAGSYTSTVTLYSRTSPIYAYLSGSVSCNSGFRGSTLAWWWNGSYTSGNPSSPYSIGTLQITENRTAGGCRYVDNFYSISGPATSASVGGVGGNGGPGQGYNQSAAAGATGFDGGTNAGRGGTGGTGGAFGTSGGNGFAGANGNAGLAVQTVGAPGGPSYGGLAGYYIVNNGNVTWTATGTRLGRVG